jgi:tetratricopeptide (TPR) repeat protein
MGTIRCRPLDCGCAAILIGWICGTTNDTTDAVKFSALLQKAAELEKRGQLAEAVTSYQKVLAREPSNIDALVRLGHIQLSQGQLEASAQALRRAVTLRPDHALGQTLLGMVLTRIGQLQEALDCFEHATAAGPVSEVVLIHMASVLWALGRHTEAVGTFDRALAIDPANVGALNNRGLALQALGRDAEAAESFRRALAVNPGSPECQFNLANVLNRMGRHEEAVTYYRSALSKQPNLARAHAGLGSALHELHRWEEALQSLRQAERLGFEGSQTDRARLHETIASALGRLQRDEESLASLDQALVLDPGNAGIMAKKANALSVLGRVDEALTLIERAIELGPTEVSLYAALSRVKRFGAGDPAIARMEGLLENLDPQSDEQRINLHFAIGKAYDDIGEANLAFPHFASGNALRRQRINYDENRELAGKASIAEFFSPALMQSKAGQGDVSNLPIFVVGMPRSGTTLVEQIIASHPHVFGAGEHKSFQDALTALVRSGQPGFPDMVPSMTGAEIKALGTDYLARMAGFVPGGQRFTDKLPANYFFVGLIHLALPNAKIVHVRRNPVDTCLSIFSIDFTDAPMFAYDLGELGRYYRAYEQLMAHWRQILPQGVMLDVQYEDVVDDIEGQARRMVSFCGLPWDDSCLAFQSEGGAVRTASAYQVRQPLFRSSVERWRAYEKHLGPLLAALGQTGSPLTARS